MKKTYWGFIFLFLAAYLLLRDTFVIPYFGISFWPLLFIIGFGIGTLQNLVRKNYTSAYICGVITFIILENQFGWFGINTSTIITAAVLAGIGLSMIFKPRGKWFSGDPFYNGFNGSSTGADTIFGNATRYINDANLIDVDGDVVFSSATFYFDNAVILGDKATYSGDAVFSNVKLFVPKDWNVEFVGDRVFSTIQLYPHATSAEKTLVVTGDFVFSRLQVFYI